MFRASLNKKKELLKTSTFQRCASGKPLSKRTSCALCKSVFVFGEKVSEQTENKYGPQNVRPTLSATVGVQGTICRMYIASMYIIRLCGGLRSTVTSNVFFFAAAAR